MVMETRDFLWLQTLVHQDDASIPHKVLLLGLNRQCGVWQKLNTTDVPSTENIHGFLGKYMNCFFPKCYCIYATQGAATDLIASMSPRCLFPSRKLLTMEKCKYPVEGFVLFLFSLLALYQARSVIEARPGCEKTVWHPYNCIWEQDV